MKLDYQLELQPIVYDENAVKVLYRHTREANTMCFSEHWHERIEILLILEGTLFLTIEGKKWQASVGEAVLIPPGVPHAAFAGDSKTIYHVLLFNPENFLTGVRGNRRLLQPIVSGKSLFPHVIRDPEATQTIHALMETYRLHENHSSLFITAYIYMFFGLLYQKLTPEVASPTTASPATEHDHFLEAIHYIDAHFAEPLSIAEISARFGYAESHFCRRFKTTTGLTPTIYIRVLRMEEAKRLLGEGERSIAKVAAVCGFQDSSYFTRCFKKVYGYAPSEYMTHCMNNQGRNYVRRLHHANSKKKNK